MESVGIRELRQRASSLLRRAEAGETIEITDRGRPVAILAPTPRMSGLERLRAAGEVIEATQPWQEWPEPLPLREGQTPPSEVLRRLREGER